MVVLIVDSETETDLVKNVGGQRVESIKADNPDAGIFGLKRLVELNQAVFLEKKNRSKSNSENDCRKIFFEIVDCIFSQKVKGREKWE